MRRTIALAAMAGLMLSAGCSTSERTAPAGPASQLPPPAGTPQATGPAAAGTCNAGAAQFLVGRLANVEATDAAKEATGAENVRVLFPGQPVTQEFEPGRLNLDTDNQNRITAVRCG
ncbi:I78 family peptidase inhibitor [Aurantimonas sp. VKM B-3413]|uniref:I78 family peptidase inhibitor n=1 Tax=Aurantimonas sp. VKM B-3413 TaxID=2779401 RepID=UPI001E600C0D|nr:I78 family peptidase inhibitor [Aurantimonas sp. VKM B-3413]MCB8837773.1 hypothetical protein [Aurantimonas sp. VKM B-3413]